MKKIVLMGLGLLLASTAMAGFSVTDPGPYNSDGPQYDPANGVFTYNYTGADFDVGDLIFEGDVTSGGVGSYLSELRVEITDPLGVGAYFSPATGTSWTGTQHIGPLTVTGGGAFWTGTAGTWEFRFWESYDDGGVDAVWTNLSFDFLDAPPPPVCVWGEDFNAGMPGDWTSVDYSGSSPPLAMWTTGDPGGWGNQTGGDGDFASADSDLPGSGGAGPFDVGLESPAVVIPNNATFEFDQYYRHLSSDEYADVDINVNGGGWVTMLSYNATQGPADHASVDLAAYANAGDTAQFRFRYYDPTGGWDWYWQVDNVCLTPEPASFVLLALGALALRRR
jgi:hypothetical protein